MRRFDLTNRESASLTWTEGLLWLHVRDESGQDRASYVGIQDLATVKGFARQRGLDLHVIESGRRTVYPAQSVPASIGQGGQVAEGELIRSEQLQLGRV